MSVTRPQQPRPSVFVKHKFSVQSMQLPGALRRHFQMHGTNNGLKPVADGVVLTRHQAHLCSAAQLARLVAAPGCDGDTVALERLLLDDEVVRSKVADLG